MDIDRFLLILAISMAAGCFGPRLIEWMTCKKNGHIFVKSSLYGQAFCINCGKKLKEEE